MTLTRKIYNKLYRSFGPQGWWPGDTRLEIIVGAILTQNTSWSNVEKAIINLKMAGALSSLTALKKVRTETLASLIRPAGYYNVKAKRLKHCIDFMYKRLGPDLGRASRVNTAVLRKELLAVHGIGPETADSILLYAFGRPLFVVDAYTRRIFSRHGLIKSDDGYDAIQSFFTGSLPPDSRLFNEYHALIVAVGKKFCKTKPRCEGCHLRGMAYRTDSTK